MRNLEPPEVSYAKSGDVSIAYQVSGHGPIDLVVCPGLMSHLDLDWENPTFVATQSHLATFARVIRFDKRGSGLSDRDVATSSLDDRMDDLRAVMDAAGSREAFVMGNSEGGGLAMLFAASYPDRVKGLILAGCFPSFDGTPRQSEIGDWVMRYAQSKWGSGGMLERLVPVKLHSDPALRQYVARYERGSMTPRVARDNMSWIIESDFRALARTIRVPTLVLHRTDDRLCAVEGARWFAQNIPDAKYVEEEGEGHLIENGNPKVLIAAVQEFMTGTRKPIEAERVLGTVLFTDIVNSTQKLSRLGDEGWRELLEHHHQCVRSNLRQFRGREIDNAGDGFLALFEGPARAVECALAISAALEMHDIRIRAGVHTGECEVIGQKVAGMTVHVGARIMAEAGPNQVFVSSTVKELVAGSRLNFVAEGARQLKGIDGAWQIFRAVPTGAQPVAARGV